MKKDGRDLRERVQKEVFSWYKEKGRKMAWRGGYGESQDPYKVLVSEVMLQQTTVKTIEKRYPSFMERFPSLGILAKSSEEEVMLMWAGLGYYRRARSLHEAVQKIERDFGGEFPKGEEEVMLLPGVGAYTGAALLSFAFRKDILVKDGNIERVMVRFGNVEAKDRKAQERAVKRVMMWYHPKGFGSEWYQALMDVGARLCRPRSTDCGVCPLVLGCRGKDRNPPLSVVKVARRVREEHYYVWVVDDGEGRFFLEKAGQGGLFGGLWIFPLQKVEMYDEKEGGRELSLLSPFEWEGEVSCLEGEVEHILTHKRMRLHVVRGCGVGKREGKWMEEREMRAVPVWVGKVLAFAKRSEERGEEKEKR